MRAGVCRKGGDRRRRVAVEDSKKLKRPNDVPDGHPLEHLERSVLAFLAGVPRSCPEADTEHQPDSAPLSDMALFSRLGAAPEPHPWYAGPPLDLPVSTTPAQIAIAANVLRLALQRAGVFLAHARCEAIGESAFNDIVDRTGTKAAATGHAITRFLRDLWDHHAVEADCAPGGPRVVCDRQGGRINYADSLGAALPGANVSILEEIPERSRYVITGAACRIQGDQRPRALTITFMPESESRHFPVALASMTAKLVRELMMARFNRYWCSVMPELKPTAGYSTDARRWLHDAAPVLSTSTRTVLMRRA